MGWIKLDRDILNNRVFANPLDLKVWVWLMCKASTIDRFTVLKIGKGNITVEVKRGEMIFGRNRAAQELGIEPSTVYRIIQKFESEQVISIKANNQFSIITVNDFIETQRFAENEEFEFEEIEQPIISDSDNQRTTNEQPTNNQRTAGEQPTNTVEESLESKELKESKESLEGDNAPPLVLTGEPGKTKNGSHKKPRMPAAKILPHTFRESEYFDIQKLEAGLAVPNYETANVPYYYECLLNWSDSKKEKKIDWLATAKNWIVRDIKKGEFVDKNFNPQTKVNGTNGHNAGTSKPGPQTAARDLTKQNMFSSLTEKYNKGG